MKKCKNMCFRSTKNMLQVAYMQPYGCKEKKKKNLIVMCEEFEEKKRVRVRGKR